MKRSVRVWAALAAVLLVGGVLAPGFARAAEAGKLALTADKWQAMLYPTPRGKSLKLAGGRDPVDVPAGKYTLRYAITAEASPKAESAAKAKAKSTPATLIGTAKITIEGGKTTQVKVGAPLTAVIKTRVNSGRVIMGLAFQDAGGNQAMVYAAAVKGKPVTPKIDVVDGGGKTVYTATMKFG
jgi:hypothetical protein